MRLKYLLSLLSVFLAFTVFSSHAEAKSVDLVKGVKDYKKVGKQVDFEGRNLDLMTDSNKNTFNAIFDNNPIFFDLGEVSSVDGFFIDTLNYYQLKISYYDSNFKVLKSYDSKNQFSEKINDVRYVSIYYQYLNRINIKEFNVFGSSDRVIDVENLVAKSDVDKVTLEWINPESTKFNGVNIYKDDKLVTRLDKTRQSYVVDKLEENKTYKFSVHALDPDGVQTPGAFITATTLMPVPKPPLVFVTPKNEGLMISWDSSRSYHSWGYNVYVDGKKINDKLLHANRLNLKGLENGKKYQIQVSAVNKNEVEGEKSEEVSGTPEKNAVEVDYDAEIPFSAEELLKTCFGLLMILLPFVFLLLVIWYFKPLKKLVVKAISQKKDRRK